MEPKQAYQIEIIRTVDGFRALEEDWQQLYSESRPRNPFLSYEWTTACWNQLCRGFSPFIVTARRPEGARRLVGVAPLRLERRSGFRMLRFIGNLWSDYLGFLQSPEHPGMEGVLLEALAGNRREWDVAVLRQLTDDYTGLHAAAVPGALCARETNGSVAPYLRHEGDWDSLTQAGPSWLRRLPKVRRLFERDGGRVVRYVGEEAAARIDEIVYVEARSWKAKSGEATFQSGPGAALVREALSRLGEQREMALWISYLGEEPVAFDLTFHTTEKIGFYHGSYHEGYRKYSPGVVNGLTAIQDAWKAGAREYDFMNGDEAYKLDQTDEKRPLRFRAFFPGSLRGRLAYGLLVAPRWWLKDYAPVHSAFHAWIRFRQRPAETVRQALQSLKRMRAAG